MGLSEIHTPLAAHTPHFARMKISFDHYASFFMEKDDSDFIPHLLKQHVTCSVEELQTAKQDMLNVLDLRTEAWESSQDNECAYLF